MTGNQRVLPPLENRRRRWGMDLEVEDESVGRNKRGGY